MIKVYVLRSMENRRRYVGLTDNLPRRLIEHGPFYQKPAIT